MDLSDEQLLDLRFCDLHLKLDESVLADRVLELYQELEERNIRFRPHCWLGEEWFSPDGVPGIGIPFYLAHPRLTKLEYRQMSEVEGSTARECMQLLRHEAGHAIMTAYQLRRSPRVRRVFGDFKKPYPDHYMPRPQSKKHVLHLPWWYAQAHPAEDFAETFAVWLRPRWKWQREYSGWPALQKLEFMDELMSAINRRTIMSKLRHKIEPVSKLKTTLRAHYHAKKEHYGINIPEIFDADLLRLFTHTTDHCGSRRLAATFLRRNATKLSQACARGTGEHPYTITQMLKEMIQRCREMKLYLQRPDEDMYMEVAVFLSLQVLHYLHRMRHRVPV